MKTFLATAALTALVPVPMLAPAAAQTAISQSDKQQGAQANPQLLAAYGGRYDGAQAALVDRVGKRVAVQSGLSNSSADFTIALLDSPVENAFAIPGGYVYVTRQLLALMNSEAELASVLGHEVGHVAARHAASRNSRATLGQILAAGVGAVTGSNIAGQLAGYGTQLYTLKYGRSQEYEADSLGVRYIAGSGYDPYAAADMLSSLDRSSNLQAQLTGQGGSTPTWASSHPNGVARVKRATTLAQQTGARAPAAGQDTAFLRALDGMAYDGPVTGAKTQNPVTATPKTLRVVAVRPRDTVDTLSARMAYQTGQKERFLVLNGLADGAALAPGTLVKIVVAR